MPVDTVLAERARNRAWAELNRGSKELRPWLAGQPPFNAHLPGVSMAIDIRPVPQWPIELRNTRGLHGAITSVLATELGRSWTRGGIDTIHDAHNPHWALRPWQSGWAIHWFHEAGPTMANRGFNTTVFDRPSEVRFGPVVRLRAPQVARRGRHRLELETVTPVVIRSDGGANRRQPLRDYAAQVPELARAASEGYEVTGAALAHIAARIASGALTESVTIVDGTPAWGRYSWDERRAPRPAAFAVRDRLEAIVASLRTEHPVVPQCVELTVSRVMRVEVASAESDEDAEQQRPEKFTGLVVHVECDDEPERAVVVRVE
jgi:hypothetical protein